MSMPPHAATMSKPMEDCRDYLRTGRCKYGASCKYNHPANVLNGGGMKPLDPSEPMFPVRPNEPICQYYMKHGTCKFAQACKFHHPPPGSNPMGFAGRRSEPAPQLMLNPVGTEPNGQMMVQFLPQRPDEPDCIYFLKNGRCKYGATCRYHHPMHPQARRVVQEKRRQPEFAPRSGQNVQYVTQVLPSYANQVGQVIVSSQENPVTFVYADGGGTTAAAPAPASYQIIQGNDGVTTYCLPQGSVLVTDQGSSASSMASSYEAAQDHLGDSQWGPRPQRNGSGNSLNAMEARQQRTFLPHVSSEGSMSQRRSRAASHGSASDHSASYYEAPVQVPNVQRSSSAGSWSQRVQGTQFRQEAPNSTRIPPTTSANRRVTRQRSPRGHRGSDEGFTMMTSALLNMLDHTPEEVANESLSDEEFNQPQSALYQEPPQANVSAFSPELKSQKDDLTDPTMMSQLSLAGLEAPTSQLSPQASRDEASTWSPTWRGAEQGPNDSAEGFSLMQRTPAPQPSPAHEPDLGLYFP